MLRPVSLAVIAVIVVASLSIPAMSETPERSFSNLDEYTQPAGEEKRLVRVHHMASSVSNEERVGPPIEINPSVISLDHEMALIRAHDVAKSFETEISIRMIGTSLAQLRSLRITSGIDEHKLILMAIGNELLKTHFHDGNLLHHRAVSSVHIMKRHIMGAELCETWKNLLTQSNFPFLGIFEMMLYLIRKTGGPTLDLSEYGYMAIGRDLLSWPPSTPSYVPNLPRSTLTRLEQMSMERGVDPTKTKIWLQWLKGQEQNSSKKEDELLLEAIKRAMGDHLSLRRGE